jgi:hypothetical protein
MHTIDPTNSDARTGLIHSIDGNDTLRREMCVLPV